MEFSKLPLEIPSKMDPKIIEKWIDDTLNDCEYLNIPGVVLKPENKNSALTRYGIDQITFIKNKVPNEIIRRIYRAMFVYSVGFSELINSALEHSNQNYTLIANIWKVYSILLEYSSKSDYQMTVTKMNVGHQQEIKRLHELYDVKIQAHLAKERELNDTIRTLIGE